MGKNNMGLGRYFNQHPGLESFTGPRVPPFILNTPAEAVVKRRKKE